MRLCKAANDRNGRPPARTTAILLRVIRSLANEATIPGHATQSTYSYIYVCAKSTKPRLAIDTLHGTFENLFYLMYCVIKIITVVDEGVAGVESFVIDSFAVRVEAEDEVAVHGDEQMRQFFRL